MKPPVKDTVTIPWMSEREIPAVKLVLSAWRKLRRDDKGVVQHIRQRAEMCLTPDLLATEHAAEVARDLELITALDARLRKEAKR